MIDKHNRLFLSSFIKTCSIACPSLAKDLWNQLAALYVPTGITSQYEAFSQALDIRIINLSNKHKE